MTRPTLRAALLFALSVPIALLIIVMAKDSWYFALWTPFVVLVFLLADGIAAMPIKRLEIDMLIPKAVYLGQREAIVLKLSGIDYTRPFYIEALMEHSGGIEEPGIIGGTMSDGKLTLHLPFVPIKRGRVQIDALWLRWRGPLGLIEKKYRHEEYKAVDVLINIQGIHNMALQFVARDAVYGIKTQRIMGEGTEFEAMREYSQGMDSRFIDWKRSAHHRKLLCKEFQQERNYQIIMGFDTGHLMLEPVEGMPKLDHAIKAGLLLSWISLHKGDFIGVCGFDSRFHSYIKPGKGMPYLTQIQRFAAGLNYRTEETNFTLGLTELNSRLQRRALVILFTEFVDTISAELLIESLQLMAKKHLVIFITLQEPMLTDLQNTEPEEFLNVAESVTADDFINERAVVLERISRLGIHCLKTTAGQVSTDLLNRYLMIKQRGLL